MFALGFKAVKNGWVCALLGAIVLTIMLMMFFLISEHQFSNIVEEFQDIFWTKKTMGINMTVSVSTYKSMMVAPINSNGMTWLAPW